MPLSIATSQVCHLAFAALGLDPVSSFADDSPQAIDAATLYPEALQSVLEGTDWTFASRMTTLLAAVPEDPPSDPARPHRFPLDPDVLLIRSLTGTGHARPDWRRDELVIRSADPGPLTIRYTARVADESRFPAAVRQVVALRLAALMAPRWAGSTPGRKAELMNEMERALTEARRQDAPQAASYRWDDPTDDWAAEAVL